MSLKNHKMHERHDPYIHHQVAKPKPVQQCCKNVIAYLKQICYINIHCRNKCALVCLAETIDETMSTVNTV